MAELTSVVRTSEDFLIFVEFFEQLVMEELRNEKCCVYSMPERIKSNAERRTETGRAFAEFTRRTSNGPTGLHLKYFKIEVLHVISNVCKGTYCNHPYPYDTTTGAGRMVITIQRRELLQRLHIFILFRFTEC